MAQVVHEVRHGVDQPGSGRDPHQVLVERSVDRDPDPAEAREVLVEGAREEDRGRPMSSRRCQGHYR